MVTVVVVAPILPAPLALTGVGKLAESPYRANFRLEPADDAIYQLPLTALPPPALPSVAILMKIGPFVGAMSVIVPPVPVSPNVKPAA
jgi:hypothetical protein